MKRKHLIVILLLFIFGVLAWLLNKTMTRIDQKQQLETNIQTLPNAALLGLDSTRINIYQLMKNSPIGGKGAIFYFAPDCEHCQAEAQALKKQAVAFADVRLLWLSVAPQAKLKAFERKYELEKTFGESLKIAQITNEVADKTFGFRIVPTILIYDSHQKLIKKYVGETKIETLQKYLKP
jgi:thiol-disulfide isomerase/thioredoxin